MSFLSGLGAWLLKTLLEWLYSKAMTEATKYEEQVKTDKERGAVNEETVKKYEDATDRAKRREAALALLNGTRTP